MYKVCVIEDETIIRKGLISAINWEQHNCTIVGEAINGAEGLKVIEKTKPDIIILDINMPIMDGLEMLSKLPANIYSYIIVSGHSEFNYAKNAIKYNVTEYLLKPVDHNLFNEALGRAITDLKMKRDFLNNTTEKKDKYYIMDLDPQVDSVTLNKALGVIHQNIGCKITMETLEKATGQSSTSISNKFKKHLGVTFGEYLTNYRIQTSINLIKQLEFHLYEIAEKVGYNDYKYFNQVFKKTMGVSPKIVELYFLRK